jgi:hypothetical protein
MVPPRDIHFGIYVNIAERQSTKRLVFSNNNMEATMNINSETAPVLGKWVVRYDDIFQMPQFVQGVIIGDSNVHKSGDIIIVRDVESIDMKDKILKTYAGVEYILVGAGRRMILLDENELLEVEFKDMRMEKYDV